MGCKHPKVEAATCHKCFSRTTWTLLEGFLFFQARLESISTEVIVTEYQTLLNLKLRQKQQLDTAWSSCMHHVYLTCDDVTRIMLVCVFQKGISLGWLEPHLVTGLQTIASPRYTNRQSIFPSYPLQWQSTTLYPQLGHWTKCPQNNVTHIYTSIRLLYKCKQITIFSIDRSALCRIFCVPICTSVSKTIKCGWTNNSGPYFCLKFYNTQNALCFLNHLHFATACLDIL